jgi:AcrR family transcriptional regulator
VVSPLTNLKISSAGESGPREQLMDAAERLVAEQGRLAASSRAIIQAAGQRHNSAITYHFGGRQELFQAVWVRGGAAVHARREEVIGRHGVAPWTLAGLIDLYITPLAEYLDSRRPSYWARFSEEALHDYPVLIAPRIRQEMQLHSDPQPLGALHQIFLQMQELIGPEARPDPALRVSFMARAVFSTYAAWEREVHKGATDLTATALAEALRVPALGMLEAGDPAS